MFQYQCLNPISKVGLDGFTNDYIKTEEMEKADAILVRSASMHEMKLPENIQAIARAGAGVNNIPLQDCAEQGRRIQYTGSQRKRCQRNGNRRHAPCIP